MKRSFALFLSMILASAVCAQGEKIILSGKIKNSSSPEIYVYVPVNGGFFSGATHVFTMDTLSGNYKISLETDKPSFIKVNNNWHTVKLYVEPGKEYIWNLDIKESGNTDEFGGYQREVNTLLNTVSSTPQAKTADINTDLSKALTVKEKHALINKALAEKAAPVQKLLKQGKVNQTFYQAFLNELTVWKKDVLSTHYYFAFRETEDGRDAAKAAAFKKEILPDWDKIYQHINDSTQWLSATSALSLLGRYSGYKEIKKTGKLIFEDGSFDKEWNNLSTNLSGKVRAFALADLIYKEYSFSEYNKKIISGFEKFKKMYPHDPLLACLKAPVEEVVSYHNNFKNPHEDVKFMELPEGTHTAEKLFPLLKNDENKISYIDMWATWCMPCRAELKYAIQLHDEFEKIGVHTVYLSFDRAEDKEKWETMAKSLVLKGTNVLASKELADNLFKTLKNFTGIPRYVILSPDGEVLEENAKRPTDNLELLKQLKYYAEKYNK